MKIIFLGANREVTGSCYFLESDGTKILIDCGLFQGGRFSEEKNYDDFDFNPAKLDYVVLTHAHLDHCGRLPKLISHGFTGKIFATNPTIDLAEIVMKDSAEIIEEEAVLNNHPPLITTTDVLKTLPHFQAIEYRQEVSLGKNINFQLKDAGHILGSAIVEINVNGKTIVFSGDLGNPPVPILRPMENIQGADYLVIESTYGDRVHEDYRTREVLLKKAILEVIAKKGTLLIPAFALERTQEILYELDRLIENKKIPQIPVFLDSPMGIEATRIFKKYPKYYNREAKDLLSRDNDFFRFPNLTFTGTVSESKKINNVPNPKIIIAGSGMMHGGRILFHAQRCLGNPQNFLLIVGFQVKNSLGRKILEGAKIVNILGQDIEIRAKVKAIGAYSAHADQEQLLSWINEIKKRKPKSIFITHGELNSSISLGEKFKEKFKEKILIPKYKEEIKLC